MGEWEINRVSTPPLRNSTYPRLTPAQISRTNCSFLVELTDGRLICAFDQRNHGHRLIDAKAKYLPYNSRQVDTANCQVRRG
jgi:hypothetical protein